MIILPTFDWVKVLGSHVQAFSLYGNLLGEWETPDHRQTRRNKEHPKEWSRRDLFLEQWGLGKVGSAAQGVFRELTWLRKAPNAEWAGTRASVYVWVGARGREGTSTFVTHTAVTDVGFCGLGQWAARSQWNSAHTFLSHILVSDFCVSGPLPGPLPTAVDEVSTICVYVHGADVPCMRHTSGRHEKPRVPWRKSAWVL